MISIVVAIAENGVIGAKGGLPWRLSSDLKRFKRDTMGKPIIMGRKTFESIGKSLPGRLNIIVTRDESFKADGAEVKNSLPDAIELAKDRIGDGELFDEICIIGGGQLYNEAMPLADKLYVTHVKMSPEGDTFFPVVLLDEWRILSREYFSGGEKDDADSEYVVYERITG